MEKNRIYLLLKHQENQVEAFELLESKSELVIGRKEFPVDIAIPHTGISRKHARIYLNKNQEVVLEDLNSTNGTYLNGIRIRKSYLQDGDVISFQKNKAEYILELKMDQKLSSQYHPFRGNLSPDARQSLQELLAEKKVVTIGRKDCDIILANLSISRQHTSIRLLDNGTYEVRDLGSKNGTFVNGEQIHQPQIIEEGDRIQIGRYEFLLQSAIYVQEENTLNEDVIIAENINQILGKGSQRKIILNNISMRIAPGELVAIMGPSGSGKSSLLKALNGYLPATSGKVFIHGRDFYENYKLLKQDIGYVPQDDIVHQQLSVQDSLYLAAKLRFASDVSREEINQKIDEILEKLGIAHIKRSLIKNISGGQRKRVSIAVELLSDPSILFLDEPTSPLDPETVEEFLKILKKLARSGTTILMVTHKPDDLDVADKVVFLSRGGYMVFFGNTRDYLKYFQAKNAIAVYASINDEEKGRQWAKKFNQALPLALPISTPNNKIIQPRKRSSFEQLIWLSVRYFKIKTNDRVNVLLLVLQAPIIAFLLTILFEKLMLPTLFLMIIASIWLGTSNAAREIVAENAIYQRERMFNLRIFPYILSKLLVINLFSLVQILLMIGIISLTIGLPHYWEHVGLLMLMAFSGSLLGLLLSATADNADKVMSIVPLILLPQIMLAGVIQRITSYNEWLSFLTLSRWGMEAAANVQETAYFYYPQKVPNSDYYTTFQDIPPMDTLARQAAEDSLAKISVPDSLYGFVREQILENGNMLEYPHYFKFEEILLALGLHIVLLLISTYVALRFKDQL